MTDTPRKAPGRPNKYEDVVRAARLLADRIVGNRGIDTDGFQLELARLVRELKKAGR